MDVGMEELHWVPLTLLCWGAMDPPSQLGGFSGGTGLGSSCVPPVLLLYPNCEAFGMRRE